MRERRHLREPFQVLPEYLKDVKGEEGETSFRDDGILPARAFRALKLWMMFKVFGQQGLRAAALHGIELAEFAERCLRREPGWEIMTPAQLGIVTFRFAPGALAPERLNLLHARGSSWNE